jgi:hypothetical protein
VTPQTVTGEMARDLAARLSGHGYQVVFPPGRDPAVFKVTGLPDGGAAEVTAEDDGRAACHYTGRSTAEAAEVIARRPAPGPLQGQDAVAGLATATWDGVEVKWHYQPSAGQAADPGQVAPALLAHLAVLDGRHDRKDGPQ